MKKNKTQKQKRELKGRPNYKIAFDGVEYTAEEQVYTLSRLVDVLARIKNRRLQTI